MICSLHGNHPYRDSERHKITLVGDIECLGLIVATHQSQPIRAQYLDQWGVLHSDIVSRRSKNISLRLENFSTAPTAKAQLTAVLLMRNVSQSINSRVGKWFQIEFWEGRTPGIKLITFGIILCRGTSSGEGTVHLSKWIISKSNLFIKKNVYPWIKFKKSTSFYFYLVYDIMDYAPMSSYKE